MHSTSLAGIQQQKQQHPMFVASSRHSEEGFHSAASSDESPPPFGAEPILGMDRLVYEIGTLAVSQKRLAFGQQKCNSDSGASSGELEHIIGMKDEGVRVGMAPIQPASTGERKMPGAWFYEELYRGEESASPTSEADDLYLAQLLCAARNISDNVEVPSSEHVAEIVGRQGCKIKALRAKTNTYIKTPVRGEEPVFVVTGKPEDVMEAKREIECAAEHFTQIRASRRHSQGGAPAPGHVTAYVRVPLRVVGLVVGPKGATIKRIQQDTHTYIITPSREREPIFEVTGLPQNVEAARKEIEQHIYQRTGNMPITDPSASITNYNSNTGGGAAAQTAAPQPPTGAHDFHSSSLSAAASAATRSSYGSLAATIRRPAAHYDAFSDYSAHGPQHQQQQRQPMSDNYQFNGMNNMMRGYGHPQQQSQKCYSPAQSPSLFGPPGHHAGNHTAPFQPWSTNTYAGLGIGGEQHPQPDMFYNRGPSSNMLSGASTWASAFGTVSCQQNGVEQHRDEGLGDSPASNGAIGENPFRLMSSIWADIEPHCDENNQQMMTSSVLTA